MSRKKNRENRILLAILLFMTIGMLALTGILRGWFDSPGDGDLVLSEDAGNAYLKRAGICFQPSEGMMIRSGDTILTETDASVELEAGQMLIKLRPETELLIKEVNGKKFLDVKAGNIFLWTGSSNSVLVRVQGKEYILNQSAAFLTAEEGRDSLLLFSGSCDTEAGELPDLQLLDMDTIEDLAELTDQAELCWTREELIEEKAERERARQKELQEKLAAQTEYSEDAKLCSIEIVCSSVLDHMDQLNQEKKPYIPADGEILKKTEVNFEEGDTVLDVLERVCMAGEIPLEYNYTPAYKSYYIEGINHLYEFDCGPASGWTYTVNGTFPNYGCSSFVLTEGDAIRWIYTCDYTSSGMEEKE